MVLHWAQNIKSHEQRKYIAQQLRGSAPPIALTYVIVCKDSMRPGPTALTDHAMMYNYAVRRLLERVSWYVDARHGEAILTFAHIRRFPYDRLFSYLVALQRTNTRIKWEALRFPPRLKGQSDARLLQVADIAAGCLSAAMTPDQFDNIESAYLEEIAPLIYTRPPGDVRSYGLNVVGDPVVLQGFPWWGRLNV